MEYRFQLSDDEFRRAWIAEYFRRSGGARRRAWVGSLIALAGLSMVRSAEVGTRAIGVLMVGFGLWQVLRPLLLVALRIRERRARGAATTTIRIRIDDRGIAVSDGTRESVYGWERVTGAGRGQDYVWFEVGGAARGTIPLRVVEDEAALVAIFRRRGKWRA